MDEHMKKYFQDKLDHEFAEMAQILKRMRDEDGNARVICLDLHMECTGDKVRTMVNMYGVPNLPQVGLLEQELGLVDAPEGPSEGGSGPLNG